MALYSAVMRIRPHWSKCTRSGARINRLLSQLIDRNPQYLRAAVMRSLRIKEPRAFKEQQDNRAWSVYQRQKFAPRVAKDLICSIT